MKLFYFFQNKLGLLFAPVAIMALASCGSYQYSGYEADGIYGESRPGIWEQEIPQTTEVKPNGNNSYYQNLFGQQADMYGEILEGDVFTDVDSYTSNDGYEGYSDVGGDVAYVQGNAPWGKDPDTYTINIYNNGFGGFYSPWSYGWGYGNPYFGYGYPFYNFGYGGFYDPYYSPFWGYNRWAYGYGGAYWGAGWAWNYGYPYSGYGYPYHSYYGNHAYYGNGHGNYAYHNTRRGSQVQNRSGVSSRAYANNSRSNTRSSYSRRIQEIRNTRSGSDYSSRTATAGRTSTNNRGDNMYTRTSRRSAPSTYEGYSRSSNTRGYSPSTTRSGTVRSSGTTTRSTGTTTRSSSNTSTRSSGNVTRGSSTTTRSSGSTSRGSGRGRG
ncbi:hypothetical protein [Gramella sp. AN32]|uniref:Vitellogenin II n=1 Tax=Christiangramia antarctica TaxID=2058158 RepID=A0ABW5X8Q1_9FLAO|nr:hypothetical protein [Gramella sp. AN32]MCM4155877.1 hypothetical protein [Gramella sp. AN32]